MLNASVFISVFRAWLGVKARVTGGRFLCSKPQSLFWVASAKIENRRWLQSGILTCPRDDDDSQSAFELLCQSRLCGEAAFKSQVS